MASVAVIIPFGGDDPHRARALDWVLHAYATRYPGWPVAIGRHDEQPWCKATAVAEALGQVDAHLLVVADADVWCDDLATAAAQCATWAVPHRTLHRLDAAATDLLINTGTPGPGRAQRPYTGHPGGGITVVRRDIYDDCPLDPRFRGWGQEDDSWAHALRTLHGPPWRGAADLVHLWHPPQQRRTRTIGNNEGRRLLYRYRAASRNPEQMRRLIAEHSAIAAL